MAWCMNKKQELYLEGGLSRADKQRSWEMAPKTKRDRLERRAGGHTLRGWL